MTKLNVNCSREEYLAPVSSQLVLFEDQAICETSFGGGIDPGEGMDWGTL